MTTPRELVKSTLEFRNASGSVPRHLWTLPWAETRYPRELASMREEFPDDIAVLPASHMRYETPPSRRGDWYAEGRYVDEWNCVFENIQAGVIGEVKAPLVDDEDWLSASRLHIPEELLTLDRELVNAYCAGTDRFVLSGELARPFERMQFIRGTENLFIDLALGNAAMYAYMEKVHDFFKRLLTMWAETDVDGLFFMDDWGSQRSLLVDPALWRRVIKPMYRDYADIAHSQGKKIFFHSDGYTLDIIPHLIDVGIDAANLQIFCIGPEKLAPYAGKITFWGEIDRQATLATGTVQDVRAAVERVRPILWKNGGAIAQCEFGAGARPENVRAVFEAWAGME
jgi:hypothetical protein